MTAINVDGAKMEILNTSNKQIIRSHHVSSITLKKNTTTNNLQFQFKSRSIIPSYKRSRKSFYPNYISISANLLNIRGGKLTYGFYPARYFPNLVESLSIKFSYHFSQQAYKSMYMSSPKLYTKAIFHGFGLGIALDIDGNISSEAKFVFTPDFETGIELPQTDNLLFDNNIDGLRTIYFKPGMKAAVFIDRYGFGIGLNYYFFDSYVRELNKSILIDNTTSEPISYSKDLFPGREGLQLSFDFIFKF
jgi:hypothetical protein